jgi:hypothetical protein
MDAAIFWTKLNQLREGEMHLQPPGQNEIGKHARKHVQDWLEYTAALEAGYRELTDRLAAYRGQAKGRTLGQVVRNQWSDGACLGYAAMAMRQAGLTPTASIGLLELMESMMQEFGLDEAAEYHQDMLDGKNEAPGILVVQDDDGPVDAAAMEAPA